MRRSRNAVLLLNFDQTQAPTASRQDRQTATLTLTVVDRYIDINGCTLRYDTGNSIAVLGDASTILILIVQYSTVRTDASSGLELSNCGGSER